MTDRQDSSTSSTDIGVVLPSIFRNIHHARRFAIDIGGSLAKVAYSSTVTPKRTDDEDEQKTNTNEEVHLHFVKFEAAYVDEYLTFIRNNMDASSVHPTICATGGGAHKYTELIEQKIGLKVEKADEVECLIRGCNLLLRNINDESFTYHHHEETKYRFASKRFKFPYILVQIGSGVSVIRVDAEDKYERIGGSAFGGGSFWGLGSLLTGARGFEELLDLAEAGDHRPVDMLVEDIYGGHYDSVGLSGDIIACSFGKTARASKNREYDAENFSPADKARSLLLTVSNSIGQMAVLYAQQQNVKRIYFGGFFIRGNAVTMRTITFAVNYFSKGLISALFLRHEGYLGAIGAYTIGADANDAPNVTDVKDLQSDDDEITTKRRSETFSWREHYAGSVPSAFARQYRAMPPRVPACYIMPDPSTSQPIEPDERLSNVDVFEVECTRTNLVACCLLDFEHGYTADVVDLTQDADARSYWLDCLKRGVHVTTKRAIDTSPSESDADKRATRFAQCYEHHLDLLEMHPFAYGRLNMRSLLDLNVQLLNEFGFPDIFMPQKQAENAAALEALPELLSELETMSGDDRELAVCQGILAGNMFDWGAGKVVEMMEQEGGLRLSHARDQLQPRPWLIDDYDKWLEASKKKTYKCAAIFVDNSGYDIVCGVVPFAIQLLRRGTKVILCANGHAVLNDVTYVELVELIEQIAVLSPVIRNALDDGSLMLADSAQTSPCLDLRRIDVALDARLQACNVDLMVIEGMGRAVHTNLEAKFNCDSLKVAVVKNEWLARRLGGDLFSVIFKYETPDTTI